MSFTDLEPVTLNPVYRSSLAVSGSLSVMATVEVLPVVRLRVVCSPLTIVLLAVSNSRILGFGATVTLSVSVTAPLVAILGFRLYMLY